MHMSAYLPTSLLLLTTLNKDYHSLLVWLGPAQQFIKNFKQKVFKEFFFANFCLEKKNY